jgi:phenylalanyl-tRNA synthetase beta chain
MRVPLTWLQEFVPWDGAPEALADRLTMAGLAVEALEPVGRLDAHIRVGRLASVERHPTSDRLYVCRVDVGAGEPVTIVSAAPGLRAGRQVPVALPGARLPSGVEVGTREFAGVASAGVLCSEAELGLGDDSGQVLSLDAEIAVGTPVADVSGVADTVLVTEVTPNRGDWLSIAGVAREIAAITGVSLRWPSRRLRESGTPAAESIRVRVEAPDLCPRYCARLVRGVRIGPSPLWVRLRLRRAGMRSINTVVDVTNYVMLERGQPLHAFDLSRIADGTIVVRRATPGERLVTLDGVERALDPADLVIADPRRAVAIAGVMGGQDSEVTTDTRDLLLESAFFLPATVRRTSRRLGLPSQAAYRFERRVDPAAVPEAADAAAALIARLAGGKVAPGIVEDASGAAALVASPVRVRPRRVTAALGIALERGEIGRRMRALGAQCRGDGDALVVTPPSYRGDLALEEDLIEEVARLGGYDAIPTTLPVVPIATGEDSPDRLFAARVRRLLVAEGLAEMVTVAFTDEETNRRLPGWTGRNLAPIAVKNPLSSEMGALRRSPLAGLIRALAANRAHGAGFVAAFEVGKSYGKGADGKPLEPRAIAVLLAGAWPPCGPEREGPAVEFGDLKGVVENLLGGLGVAGSRTRFRPVGAGEVSFVHPGKAAVVEIDGSPVGVLGALHPEVMQVFDLTGEVWVSELDFTATAHYVPRRFDLTPPPRFPAVARDIAVIVDEAFLADDILEEIQKVSDPRIESARLFDCYRGAPIPAGQKSLAYAIAYRAADRTLTDDEVNALHDRVRAHLTDRFSLTLRS